MAKANYTVRGATAVEDQLFISTLQKRVKSGFVQDQVFNKRPALAWLLSRKDTERLTGGSQFEIPIGTGKNPHGGMIDENEGISLDSYDPLDMLKYWPKLVGYNVRHDLATKAVNRGEGKLFSIIDYHITNTVKTVRDTLNSQLWTGNGQGKNATGLPILIPATVPASQSTSVGGKDPSTNSYWRTQATNMSGIAASTKLETYMLNMVNTITAYGGNTDVIFCDQATEEIYENNMLDYVVLQKTKIGDVSFEMVKYKTIAMIFDLLAPSGEMRFVDSATMKMFADPMFWFAWTGFKEVPDVPFLEVKQIVNRFQFGMTERRTQGCLFNISETGA